MRLSLRARLTLWSVVLMAFVVSFIGVLDVGNEMQQQFDFTMERAELLRRVATYMVVQTLDRQRTVPLREALRDPELSSALVDIVTASRALLEIAVCDRNNEILADSDPGRLGKSFPGYAPFEPVVDGHQLVGEAARSCSGTSVTTSSSSPWGRAARRCSTCG